MRPGGLWWSNVLNSDLPPQRLRPDTWPEHQDPVSIRAQKKREEKKKKERKKIKSLKYKIKKIIKIKSNKKERREQPNQ